MTCTSETRVEKVVVQKLSAVEKIVKCGLRMPITFYLPTKADLLTARIVCGLKLIQEKSVRFYNRNICKIIRNTKNTHNQQINQ
ncbi:MAG: hypothetical protein LBQ66_08880 [Planctomycetaceae bacterium]|nr:hypothetical protein [Planctomycetaceae bacterium]